MPKPSDWCHLACVATVLAAIAAPAWAQQNGQPLPPANPPIFKEPLSTADLFARGRKNKTVQAQPQAPAQPRPAPFKKRFFDKLDTNNDAVVSRDEFLAQANRQFNALDLNHDGRLTADEINAAVEQAQANPNSNPNAMANGNANSNVIGADDLSGRRRKRNLAPAQ